MTDHVYDYDWQSAYPSLIKPDFQVYARGSDKSQAQLQMYDAILKGENEMNIKAGYSPMFAKYISIEEGRYKTAIAMASLPDVSMDIKVMAIFMDNQGD